MPFVNDGNIRAVILVPFTLILVVIVGLFIGTGYMHEEEERLSSHEFVLNQVQDEFQEQIAGDAQMAHAAIWGIVNNRDIAEAFLARDRRGLMNLAAPLYGHFAEKHPFTHLYFIDLQRRVFLRGHQPDRHGDVIDRQTLLKAERTGASTHGLELGVFGTFTLRIVVPWRVDGKLIGYVELGEEIDHVIENISRRYGVHLVTIIRKDLLERGDWEVGQGFVSEKADWNDLNDVVVVGKTDLPIGDELKAAINEHTRQEEHYRHSHAYRSHGSHFLLDFINLDDFGGHSVGDAIVIHDTTRIDTAFDEMVVMVTSLSLMGGVLVFVAFFFILGRVKDTLRKGRETILRAKEEAEAAEISMKQAQAVAKIGNWSLNVKTGSLIWSDECYRIFGVPPGRFKPSYEAFLAAVHPDDVEYVNAQYEQAMKGGVDYDIEHRIIRPHSNEVRWVHEKCELVRDRDGDVIRTDGVVMDVTERRASEQAIRESEERFRDFSASASDWFWEMDENLKFSYFSERFEKASGLRRDDFLGKSRQEMGVAGVDADQWAAHQGALEGRRPFRDFVYSTKWAKQTVWLSVSGTPVFDEAGTFRGYRGTGSNITAQRQRDLALADSEKRFRNIVEATSDWIWEIDAKGVYTYASPSVGDLLGYQPHDIIGKSPLDLIPESDRETVGTTITKILNAREPFADVENVNVHKTGEIVILETSGVPIISETGEFGGFRGVDRDITARKKTEEVIARLNRTNRLILESSGDGIYGIDLNGDTTFVNPAAERLLGWSAGELLGRHSHELFHHTRPDGSPYPGRECNIYQTLRDGRVRQIDDEYFWREDGTGFPVSYVATPALEEGRTVGAVIVFRDITEQKAQAEQLSVARDAAEAANAAKSAFLATMSHEIRTPMSGVMGIADLLLEEDLPPGVRDKVGQIKGATDSLTRIINDILDISKMESGKLELEFMDFHAPSLLREVMGLFSQKVRAEEGKRLELRVEVASDFPRGVHSDPTRLRQILINLIGNAVKFTHAGHVTVRAERSRGADGDLLRFSVEDTGIGLEAEAMDGLFGAFTQADVSITRRFEGSGLGLSICKRLVEMMGGGIGVESEPGRGSTFWFTLPYIPATTEVEEAGRSVERRILGPASRRLRILAAEDNHLNQQIIVAMMGRLGHSVEIAGNGALALEALRREDFDLILMDVRMPEMSGPDATRAIRQLSGPKASIPIIGLTADALEGHRQDYLDAGMDDVVTKPIVGGHM